MAKGKIKTSTDNEHGIITLESGKDLNYVQPYSKELGLRVGMTVRLDVITDPKTLEKTGVNVQLYKKGIITGKDNDTGMIADVNFGDIPAYAPYMKEQGIISGTEVRYEILQSDTGPVAVYLQNEKP